MLWRIKIEKRAVNARGKACATLQMSARLKGFIHEETKRVVGSFIRNEWDEWMEEVEKQKYRSLEIFSFHQTSQ